MSTPFLSREIVRKIIGGFLRNRSAQLLRAGPRSKQYLNVGCGGNIPDDYINLDYRWRKGVDLCWDLRKGIPLETDSLDGIFTEHLLEHFTWREGLNLILPECFRVLRPGGRLRISVPDAALAVSVYEEARRSGVTEQRFRATYDGGDRIPMTPMTHVNNSFRRIYEPLEVGHKFLYDFQTLEYFLHCVGFTNITKEVFLRGHDPRLLVDYKKRANESLYVEATKPIQPDKHPDRENASN